MSARNKLAIPGCRLNLLGFLKALGFFRSIYLQFDKKVKGYWDEDSFVIETSLEKGELIACFAKRFRPLPVLSPLEEDRSGDIYKKLANSSNPMLEHLQHALNAFYSVKDDLSGLTSPFPSTKWLHEVERNLNVMPDVCAPSYKALAMFFHGLGDALRSSTGSHLYGNYRFNLMKLKIEENYLASVAKLIDFTSNAPSDGARRLFIDAVFSEPKHVEDPTISHNRFQFNRWDEVVIDFHGNPWDYVFAVYGLVALCKNYPLLAKIPLPFFLKAIGSRWVFGSENSLQKVIQREVWLPLWNSPLEYKDLVNLLTKFAVSLEDSQLTSALDLTCEGAVWGINPLLSRFLRVGLSFDAKMSVLPETVNLGVLTLEETKFPKSIGSIRSWMSSLEEYIEPHFKGSPQTDSLRNLETSLFAFLVGEADSFLPCLMNLGMFLKGTVLRPRTKRPEPLVLSHEILDIACEESPEFRIALAIASLSSNQPVRQYFEPVSKSDTGEWVKSDLSSVVSGNLIDKLGQLIEARVNGAREKGLNSLGLTSCHPARRSDVELFLSGKTNDDYLESLLYGLILIDYPEPVKKPVPEPQDSTLIDFHLLLRRCFLCSNDYPTLMLLIKKIRFSSLAESLKMTKELCEVHNLALSPSFHPSLNLNQRLLASLVIDSV